MRLVVVLPAPLSMVLLFGLNDDTHTFPQQRRTRTRTRNFMTKALRGGTWLCSTAAAAAVVVGSDIVIEVVIL